jgi:hypothetical protein
LSFAAVVFLASARTAIRRSPGTASIRIFLPFTIKFCRENANARCIAARLRHRGREPLRHHVIGNGDNGNLVCRLLYGAGCRSTAALDDIDLGFNQFRCVLRKKIDVLPKFAVVDSEVFALDETITAQFLEERGSVLCVCV